MDSRVGELALTVRMRDVAPPGVGADVEAFAARVLDRCASLLEARAPGRVIRLRTLEMRWRLREGTLGSANEVDAVATALAAAIDARALGAPRADGDADIAVFVDEGHWGAEVLRAMSRSALAPWWVAPILPEGRLPGRFADSRHRAATSAAFARLAVDGDVVPVLAALPDDVTSAIAVALDLGPPWHGERPSDVPAGPVTRGPDGDLARRCLDMIAPWLARPALPLVAHAFLAHLLAPDTPTPQDVARVVAMHETRGGRRIAAHGVPGDLRAAGEAAPVGDDATGRDLEATRAAGLVYLLRPALELEVGEILWRACLDERVVLARVWRARAALVAAGLAGDPLVTMLGGADPDAAPGALDAAAASEAAVALLGALGRALPRHGRTIPPLRVALAHGIAGRAIVAWLDGMPIPVHAAPATGMAGLRNALRALVAAWPSEGRILAPPALASLAGIERFAPAHRAATHAGEASALAAIAAAPTPLDALTAIAGGAIASLVAWRAGWTGDAMAGELARTIAQPGTVAVEDDALVVAMPMRAIDLVLRRAALDRDPGWVPWLGRAVRIAYREGDEDPPPAGR